MMWHLRDGFPKGGHQKLLFRVFKVTHGPTLYQYSVTAISYVTVRAFKIICEAYKKFNTVHKLPLTVSIWVLAHHLLSPSLVLGLSLVPENCHQMKRYLFLRNLFSALTRALNVALLSVSPFVISKLCLSCIISPSIPLVRTGFVCDF